MCAEGRSLDRVVRRICARGVWRLVSPAHFGSGDDGGTADMTLLRDADGHPFVPGASIAGALRSYITRRLLGNDLGGKEDPPEVNLLFGGRTDTGKMSRLLVFDANPEDANVRSVVRDGVRIEEASGTAADAAKFDMELVRVGTSFVIRLECVLRAEDEDDSASIRRLLQGALHGLGSGDVRLGARTRRGFGRGEIAAWQIREIDPTQGGQLLEWLSTSPCPPCESTDPFWREATAEIAGAGALEDHRRSIRFDAELELEASMLIRSHLERPASSGLRIPDVEHLRSGDAPAVPGTSAAGALRHRVAFIARSLWGPSQEGNVIETVESIFGPLQKARSGEKGIGLRAGKIRVEEKPLRGVAHYPQTRVAIDRFTGGALDGALFCESPIRPEEKGAHGPHVILSAELFEPEDGEAGLLLLAFKDLLMGRLALGGEASVGRGTARAGTVKVSRLGEPGIPEVWEIKRERGGTLELAANKAGEMDQLLAAAGSPPRGRAGASR